MLICIYVGAIFVQLNLVKLHYPNGSSRQFPVDYSDRSNNAISVNAILSCAVSGIPEGAGKASFAQCLIGFYFEVKVAGQRQS
jgi:hypothetical protein